MAIQIDFDGEKVTVEQLPKLKKLRMKNWYWGHYVVELLPHTTTKDYEEYIETVHGWHNSEEYKTGYRLVPYHKN